MNWIDINEQKPPDGVEVLTYPGWCAGSSGITIDEWSEKYGCFFRYIEDPDRVTHWMPLPKAPKAENLAKICEEGIAQLRRNAKALLAAIEDEPNVEGNRPPEPRSGGGDRQAQLADGPVDRRVGGRRP